MPPDLPARENGVGARVRAIGLASPNPNNPNQAGPAARGLRDLRDLHLAEVAVTGRTVTGIGGVL